MNTAIKNTLLIARAELLDGQSKKALALVEGLNVADVVRNVVNGGSRSVAIQAITNAILDCK